MRMNLAVALVATLLATPALAQDMQAVSWDGTAWSIDSTTGATVNLGATGFIQVNSQAVSANGTVYAIAGLTTAELITISPGGVGTLVGPVAPAANVRSLAYDDTTDTLYAFTPTSLYSIDPLTGTTTLVALTGLAVPNAAEITPDGTLYVWNGQGGLTVGGLHTVDKMTGVPTQIAPSTAIFNWMTSDGAGNLYVGQNNSGTILSLDLFGNTSFVSAHSATDVRGVDFVGPNVTITPFCFGDGGDQMGCTNCPCGNNAGIGSGGGCLNSAASSAVLDGSGVPEVGNDTLRFEVTGASPMTFGVLVSADNQLPNAGACPPGSGIPAFDGLRCVGGALQRHGTRATDGNGDIGLTNNGWGPPSGPAGGLIASGGFIAGQTRHFQCFYRESATAGCLTGQNTTNAVSVMFL